jgi:DNA-binding CsgD family transcriptional regulator
VTRPIRTVAQWVVIVAACVARGMTIAETAVETDVSYGTLAHVLGRLRRAGYKFDFIRPPVKGRGSGSKPLAIEVRAAVLHMLATGAASREIADELDVKEHVVASLRHRERLRRGLYRERRWLGVSRKKLAARAGYCAQTVRNVENGTCVRSLIPVVRALQSMRAEQLQRAHEALTDRGTLHRHVLDVCGADDLDDALDNISLLASVKLCKLRERERLVLEFWLQDETLKEIGDRLNVSRERARQILMKIRRRLEIREPRDIVPDIVISQASVPAPAAPPAVSSFDLPRCERVWNPRKQQYITVEYDE